ncbi:DUF2695 domain-containing protein [Dysgonomonas sp. 521]|uniref:DUF2695 domain-containing protein n=1 Tax=Dysgonomonas sp. 521 TaxID=2302932 RepID=UPI0013D290F3|nr:DUF2695 domain-containing protein [Dysgonomonas sp. 521]NDV94296.1 DUF2695 domain-containing protein [Dysgonomonas sp. 521]
MDKKAMKKAFKEKEMREFRESLPMKETDFLPLFDFLDNELTQTECAGNLSLLEKYCAKEKLDFISLKEWFRKYGGYCDCEILGNVEEQFYYLEKPEISKIQPKKSQAEQRIKLNELTTDFGFSIKKVPSPWILTAISRDNVTNYQFQIGKKSYFSATLERDFVIEKLAEDKFLHDYWTNRTELDYELEFVIDRQHFNDFEIIQIRTRRWAPSFVFVYKQGLKWCLIMKTETARVKNDIKELERLLKEI